MKFTALSVLLNIFLVSHSKAERIIETQDALEIDWSAAKIRQKSQVVAKDKTFSWKSLDQQAKVDGIVSLREQVFDLHRHEAMQSGYIENEASKFATAAAKMVETTTWIVKTEYSTEGRLTHLMENRLSRALKHEKMEFSAETEAAESPFTGLIFRLTTKTQPTGVYKILDESGNVLMDTKSVKQIAFDERLMGKWFKSPSRQEITRTLGRRPLSVEVDVVSKGVFKIPSGRWADAVKGHESLIQNSKIIIALPS